MATKTKAAPKAKRAVKRAGSGGDAQLSADVAAISAFLAKLPGIESSLAAEHAAICEIARRRNA